MKSFFEILPETLQKLGLIKKYRAETIFFHWREIVGDQIAAHTHPARIERGVLTVGTSTAVWAHHLMTSREDIIAKINNFYSEELISDIKFKAGYLQNDQNEENNNEIDLPAVNWKQASLSEADQTEVDKTAEVLSDDKLRKRVRQILQKDASLKKAKQKMQWHSCPECGILCSPDADLCTVCSINRNSNNREKIRKILIQAPCLEYKDFVKYINCHETEYNKIKNEIIDTIIKETENGLIDRMRIATLVMLSQKAEPQAITDKVIDDMIDKIRRKKHVFTFGS